MKGITVLVRLLGGFMIWSNNADQFRKSYS